MTMLWRWLNDRMNTREAIRRGLESVAEQRIADRERRYGGGLLCATCRRPIAAYSDENDFVCSRCGAVHAIRVRDGAVLAGDGYAGEPRIIRMDVAVAPYYGFQVF